MKYTATVVWQKIPNEKFSDNRYSRKHTWLFDGGTELTASSSPQVVPVPMSDEYAVDPEEAFLASLASCHMLFFLSIAAVHRYVVESYEDHAQVVMGYNEEGKLAMTAVTLQPRVIFSGENIPLQQQVDHMHYLAHEKCYIANSVKAVINIISQ